MNIWQSSQRYNCSTVCSSGCLGWGRGKAAGAGGSLQLPTSAINIQQPSNSDLLPLIFATNLVEDNLPDLHYKKLLDFFAPVILLAYIGLPTILVKITKNPEQKKILMTLTVLFAASILITKALGQSKKQTAS
jgi:hypothetical protein